MIRAVFLFGVAIGIGIGIEKNFAIDLVPLQKISVRTNCVDSDSDSDPDPAPDFITFTGSNCYKAYRFDSRIKT